MSMVPDAHVAGAIPTLSSLFWIYDRFSHAPIDACRLLGLSNPSISVSKHFLHVQMQVVLIQLLTTSRPSPLNVTFQLDMYFPF